MSTEAADARYADLERRPLGEAIAVMWHGQQDAVGVIEGQLAALASAAQSAAERLREGNGRIAYVGAGTSGRLAVQDGVELTPTFGWPRDRLAFCLAGGDAALTGAVEGAEDDEDAGRAAIAAQGLLTPDVLIALAASGRTPFTCAAVEAARERGTLTIAIANNRGTRLLAGAEHAIVLETRAEVIAGSTRMGAGTAQRAALTVLSSAIMIALGRVHGGRMIAMRPTNAKLHGRAVGMVAELAQVDEATAQAALAASAQDVSVAVLIARGMAPDAARARLARCGGLLAAALAGGD